MAEIWISSIIIIALFYIFIILPQQIANRRHRKELALLKEGDTVATVGGLVGKITALDGELVSLQVAPDVNIKVLRSAISHRFTVQSPEPTRQASDGEDNTA